MLPSTGTNISATLTAYQTITPHMPLILSYYPTQQPSLSSIISYLLILRVSKIKMWGMNILLWLLNMLGMKFICKLIMVQVLQSMYLQHYVLLLVQPHHKLLTDVKIFPSLESWKVSPWPRHPALLLWFPSHQIWTPLYLQLPTAYSLHFLAVPEVCLCWGYRAAPFPAALTKGCSIFSSDFGISTSSFLLVTSTPLRLTSSGYSTFYPLMCCHVMPPGQSLSFVL